MRRADTASGPLTLLIKPASGLCNLRCGYCFYRAAGEGRDNAVMTQAVMDELIRKIGACRPLALSVIFQGGEPTLAGLDFFKAFVNKVHETVRCRVDWALQTNGTLLDEGFIAFLRDHRFLVGISIDGDRRVNDRYRLDKNGESVLARTLEAADALANRRVDFNILSVIDDKNADDIEQTWRFFRERDFRFLQFIPCVDENCGASLSPDRYARFLKTSFDLWFDELRKGTYVSVRHIDNYVGIQMGRQPESCAMRGYCGGYFVVEADGTLYPCDFYCREAYRIGSVFDERPFEPHAVQQAFIRDSLRIRAACETCRYYRLCRGGCRRDRTGDLLKNRYCPAYRAFFDYAAERMAVAAKMLSDPTFGR